MGLQGSSLQCILFDKIFACKAFALKSKSFHGRKRARAPIYSTRKAMPLKPCMGLNQSSLKLWWNKQKKQLLDKHPCHTQVGSLQSTNALQMKLAPKPTLIIVASSKMLIQVEHDNWRFRERTVISPKSITGVSVNQKGKNTIDPGTITHPLTCKVLSDLVYCR
jgi:hypothetical protein